VSIVLLLREQTKTEALLLRYSGQYVSLLVSKKLDRPQPSRHVAGHQCLLETPVSPRAVQTTAKPSYRWTSVSLSVCSTTTTPTSNYLAGVVTDFQCVVDGCHEGSTGVKVTNFAETKRRNSAAF